MNREFLDFLYERLYKVKQEIAERDKAANSEQQICKSCDASSGQHNYSMLQAARQQHKAILDTIDMYLQLHPVKKD